MKDLEIQQYFSHFLGMVFFFFAIELGNFKTKGAVWGSFHTENRISNFV